MLRGVGIVVDFLGDHLADSGLFSEPFAAESGHRVPSYLNGAQLAADRCLTGRNDVGLSTKTDRVLEHKFAL